MRSFLLLVDEIVLQKISIKDTPAGPQTAAKGVIPIVYAPQAIGNVILVSKIIVLRSGDKQKKASQFRHRGFWSWCC